MEEKIRHTKLHPALSSIGVDGVEGAEEALAHIDEHEFIEDSNFLLVLVLEVQPFGRFEENHGVAKHEKNH